MDTKITFHREYIAPQGSVTVPHAESGWVQVFGVDYMGGQGTDGGYMLQFAVIEPIRKQRGGGASSK